MFLPVVKTFTIGYQRERTPTYCGVILKDLGEVVDSHWCFVGERDKNSGIIGLYTMVTTGSTGRLYFIFNDDSIQHCSLEPVGYPLAANLRL